MSEEHGFVHPQISTQIEVTYDEMEVDSWGRKYPTYMIEIVTNDISFNLQHSRVKRRFSDFVWLRKRILSESPVHKSPVLRNLLVNHSVSPRNTDPQNQTLRNNIAHLPKRYLFSRLNPEVIREREEGLEKFLQSILQSETVLSDPCAHLLLQSTLSVQDVEEWMKNPKRQSSSNIIMEGKDLVTPEGSSLRDLTRPPSRTSDNRSLCPSIASDDFPISPVSPINRVY